MNLAIGPKWKYLVVVASTPEDITELVNDRLEHDWMISGSLCVVSDNGRNMYAQALVRASYPFLNEKHGEKAS